MSNKPFIALNLKSYEQSYAESGLELCRIAKELAKETNTRVITCPNPLLLREAVKVGGEIFAQHVDGNHPGAFTGSITSKMLLGAGVKGSLINHSEKRMNPENIKVSLESLKEVGLESMVCAQDVNECAQYAAYKPTYIAIEPPELIGSGVSVSTAKPEVVSGAISAVREVDWEVEVVCGAGVSEAKDFIKAIEIGVSGVLLASAYVKSKNPREFLRDMLNSI